MVQSIDDARRAQRRAPGTRVPPHNLQAEESLLGAMLLSSDAVAAALEAHISADDFYKPSHGHIFDAICALHAGGERPDAATVADDVAPDDVAADVALAGLPDDEVELVPEEGGSEAEVVDSTPPAEETEAP